jgi:hypothetical protein
LPRDREGISLNDLASSNNDHFVHVAMARQSRAKGLDDRKFALYSRKEAWVQDCLAMIVGRIVYAGSKLALSNQADGSAPRAPERH